MYHKTAVVLAILGFSARFALAYDPLCCLPLCSDHLVMVEPCCEPICCEPLVSLDCCELDAARPKAAGPPVEEPSPVDTPQRSESNRITSPPAPVPLPEGEPAQPQATTPTAPPPSTFAEPATPPAEEETIPPAETEPEVAPPAVEPSTAAPPAVEPATEEPSRYTPLPEPAPAPEATAPAPGDLEDPFTEAPVPNDEQPVEDELEPAPTEPEEPSIDDQLFDTQSAPATTEAPQTPEEQPEEHPAEPSDPDVESLFGPSAAWDVLSEPGGWASTSDRTWRDASGDELGPAKLAAINGHYVVLRTNDGGEHIIRFDELSRDDLGFLRRQIDARETELAQKAKDAARLAASK